MSFAPRITAFAERFLSDRAFQLVVVPALADLDFDPGATPRARLANRLAVVKAVAGALGDDLKRDSPGFVGLALVPTCYYLSLMAVCFDAFQTWAEVLTAAVGVAAISMVPVMVCFWPARRPARPGD